MSGSPREEPAGRDEVVEMLILFEQTFGAGWTVLDSVFLAHSIFSVVFYQPEHISLEFHCLVHVVDYMAIWGPLCGWWTFPFERFYGQLTSKMSAKSTIPYSDCSSPASSNLRIIASRCRKSQLASFSSSHSVSARSLPASCF